MLPAQMARGLKNVKFEKAGLPAKSEMHDGTVTVPSWYSYCTMTLFAVQCGQGFERDLREFCLNQDSQNYRIYRMRDYDQDLRINRVRIHSPFRMPMAIGRLPRNSSRETRQLILLFLFGKITPYGE